MDEALKRWIRPIIYPPLHAWQRLYVYSTARLREYEARRERDKVLRNGTTVLQDAHGIRLLLYSFDHELLTVARGNYDVAEFRAICGLVRPGDIAFDVGANVGRYSVWLSRLCGPNGRVWAFEPVPDTYWRLRETLALNRCENVVTVQIAVGDKSGNVDMSVFEPRYADLNTLGSPSTAMANWNPVHPVRSIVVPVRTLDEVCESEAIRRINFFKVDVEGFELAVFRGAERLLREHRVDYLCFEIFQPALRDAGLTSRQVFSALEFHGYNAYRFDMRLGAFVGPMVDADQAPGNFFASYKDLSNLQLSARTDGARRLDNSLTT